MRKFMKGIMSVNNTLFVQALVGLSDQTGRLTGTFTSLIDSYINIKKYIEDVNIKTFVRMPSSNWIDLCIKNRHFGSKRVTLSMTKEKNFSSDIIVCSARFLIDIVLHSLNVECNNMIILDSFDAACFRFLPQNNLDQIIPTKNFTFLANKANIKAIGTNSYEYYHKFSKERLETLSFDHKHFYYSRKDKWYIKTGRKTWFENIGKGIFERIYHGVNVHYSTKGMTTKDGLYHYLNLFGIDGCKDHFPLPMTKIQIENLLFMRDDDLLLKTIRKG